MNKLYDTSGNFCLSHLSRTSFLQMLKWPPLLSRLQRTFPPSGWACEAHFALPSRSVWEYEVKATLDLDDSILVKALYSHDQGFQSPAAMYGAESSRHGWRNQKQFLVAPGAAGITGALSEDNSGSFFSYQPDSTNRRWVWNILWYFLLATCAQNNNAGLLT